jgi:hypothetical protein
MNTIISKISIVFMLATPIAFATSAQKLPKTQETSLSLPSNAKADGKATEWDNKFQFYNTSTNVMGVIANNKENFYLAIRATDALIIKKIISGGISLTVCTSGQRNDSNPFKITFPVIPLKSQGGINISLNELNNKRVTNLNKDSLASIVNTKLASVEKEIKVSGFKTITDSAISVYNDFGIKAATLIDNSNALTYELMIPIKLLGLADKKGVTIAYNVMLNGVSSINTVAVGTVSVANVPRSLTTNGEIDFQVLGFAADFWATYTFLEK